MSAETRVGAAAWDDIKHESLLFDVDAHRKMPIPIRIYELRIHPMSQSGGNELAQRGAAQTVYQDELSAD
jgi:hypothetical protein